MKRLTAWLGGVVLVVGSGALSRGVDGGMTAAAAETPPMKADQVKTEQPPAMPLALTVVGTKILNSRNEPVRLRGVNCASMEWTSDGEGHILQTVNTAIRDWHVNHVRLPLAQDRWFGKAREQKDEGKAYRALVHEVVDLCASQGVYIILDLHWSDTGQWGKNIGQHSMPDENSLAFWRDMAPVYANHPAVIYDLYNEPHDVSWDIWLKGGKVTDRPNDRRGGPPQTYEAVGMQKLLDTVRAAGAKNVIIAGGLDWAYDFSGILEGRQLKDPDGNGVIYANHAYNNKGHSVEVWIARMEKATAKLPVIVSEFGGSGGPNRKARRGGGSANPTGDDWLLHVMQALEDHQWSWTAWDLHPAAGPTLISDWKYAPTPDFGVFVKQALVGKLPRYTPPVEFDPFAGPKPLLIFIQSDPWLMVMGSDTPRVAVYENGDVIFLKKVNDRLVYHHVTLDKERLGKLRERIQPVIALKDLKLYNIRPYVTDQPEAMFYFRDGDREIATSVYGLMAAGTKSGDYTEFPDSPKPTPPPKALLTLHKWLCELDYPGSREWIPKYVEVMLWDYSDAPEASIKWPKDWPSLKSDRVTKHGDVYSIFLDGSLLPKLRNLLATQKEKGAVEVDGKKMAASYRLTFPGEPAWGRAFAAAAEREARAGDKGGG